MPWVVFLRAVNVGRTVLTGVNREELAKIGAVNIGPPTRLWCAKTLANRLCTRRSFYPDPCRRSFSPHSSSTSHRHSSTRLSNVSISLSRCIQARSSASFRWDS
jgi:hypothetical protein